MPESPRYARNRCIWLKQAAIKFPHKMPDFQKWMEELFKTTGDSVCGLLLIDFLQSDRKWSQATDIALTLTSLSYENQMDGERLAAGVTILCLRASRSDCEIVSAHIRKLCINRLRPWDPDLYNSFFNEYKK